MKQEPITRERIDELLHYLPLFSHPTEALNPTAMGGGEKHGIISLGIPIYPPVVEQFFELARHPCWNDEDYLSKATHEMLADDAVIAAATLDQVKTMLTFCNRGERFCDGFWIDVIQGGRIGAILARLEQLREAAPSDAAHIEKLKQLLDKCWNAFDRLHDEPFVVRPAVPILFFGDSDRYFASPLKVVTVGLNPSLAEFPEHDRFVRFPDARELGGDSDRRNLVQHLEALNSYFRIEPFKRWFASFEPILQGLDASYYGGTNTELHTDICSPIATDPTWSGLAKDQRVLLQAEGVHIWHSLLEILTPDIIIISVAAEHLKQIRFPFDSPAQEVFTIDRKHPYRVWGRFLTINPPNRCFLVFGRAATTPFGTVLNTDKHKIGAAIREKYSAPSR